jgi:hypothetical protein
LLHLIASPAALTGVVDDEPSLPIQSYLATLRHALLSPLALARPA